MVRLNAVPWKRRLFDRQARMLSRVHGGATTSAAPARMSETARVESRSLSATTTGMRGAARSTSRTTTEAS